MNNYDERYQRYLQKIKKEISQRSLLSDFWSVFDWAWGKNELAYKTIIPLYFSVLFLLDAVQRFERIKAILGFAFLVLASAWVWFSLNKAKDSVGIALYPFEYKHQIEKRMHCDMVREFESIIAEMADKQDNWGMQQYEKRLQETVSFYEYCLDRVDKEQLS